MKVTISFDLEQEGVVGDMGELKDIIEDSSLAGDDFASISVDGADLWFVEGSIRDVRIIV